MVQREEESIKLIIHGKVICNIYDQIPSCRVGNTEQNECWGKKLIYGIRNKLKKEYYGESIVAFINILGGLIR